MEWLKRILRCAFEDATKSLLSTLFIMIFTYGATRLWQHISDKYFLSDDLIRITTVSLQEGHVGEQYKSTLTAEVDGVIREVEWSSHSLPLGLYLNGEVIEGIPQVAGQYALTVIATNGTISDFRILPLIVKERHTSQQEQESVAMTNEKSISPNKQKTVEIINKVPPLNDKVSTATTLQSGMKYSGNLVKKFDSRYYTLNLETPATVTFMFTAAGLSSYLFSVQQINQPIGTNITTEFDHNKDSKSFTENFNLYLRSGNYLLKITGGKVWREDEKNGNLFTLTLKTSKDESCEAESNNTLELANPILVNKTIRASSYKNDIDYFTFNLDRKATVFPQLCFESMDEDDFRLYEIIVKNEYGRELESYIYRGSNKLLGKKHKITLDAGKYVLCVSRIEDESILDLGIHEYRIYLEII